MGFPLMDSREMLLDHHLRVFRGKSAPAVQIAAVVVRPRGRGRLRRPRSAAVEIFSRAHRDRADAASGGEKFWQCYGL